AHGLEGNDDGRHRPTRQQLLDLSRQPVTPSFGVLDGVNVILQYDLLRRMIEAHRRQPPLVRQGPRTSPAVDLLMTQQKALQMLPRLAEHPDRGRPRPD